MVLKKYEKSELLVFCWFAGPKFIENEINLRIAA
jgi:hypothetical protein